MQHNQCQLRHHIAIVLLQNVAIDIELERVVPVIRIRQMRHRSQTTLEPVLRLQLSRPLPVIDRQSSIGLLVDHINGTGDLVVLVKHEPLRTKRHESVPLHIAPLKVAEVVPLCARIGNPTVDGQTGHAIIKAVGAVASAKGHRVVEPLNVQVHPRSCRRGLRTLVGPLLLDLFRGHSVVLGLVPLGRLHHLRDDRISVELAEEMMEKSGTRGPALLGTVNRVCMRLLLKLDMIITRMLVDHSQSLPFKGTVTNRKGHRTSQRAA